MKRSELIFTVLLIPLDFLALVAAAVAGYYARFHPFFTKWKPVIFDLTVQEYLQAVLPIALLWLVVFALAGLYAVRRTRIATELTRVILSCSAAMALVFAALFFSRTFFESRFIAVASWVLAILFVASGRVVVRLLQRSLIRFGIGEHRIVIIGDDKSTDTLSGFLKRHHRLGFHVVKTFASATKKNLDAISKMKKREGVDELWLADAEASRETALDLLQFSDAEHLHFRYTADLFAAATGKTVYGTYAGIPVIEVKKTPLDGWGAIYKRVFDVIGSSILIILTLPIQLIVVIALFLEQPGRVLFSRLPDASKTMRVGQGGEPFHYFKFRSMIKDAHKYRDDPEFLERHGNKREGTPLFKLEDDPRVTRVGRVLRRFSIDEFPEFYLVLLGRMSLVGPRPHLPEEVDKYTPLQRKVLTVKPGITGMAQISGRADIDFDEEVRLDIHYIENWSPWLDLVILLKTPIVVLFGRGAY